MQRTLTGRPSGSGNDYDPVVLQLRRVSEDEVPANLSRLAARGTARRVRVAYESPDEARTRIDGILRRSADALTFYDVVEDDRAVGWVVWWQRGDQCEVNDVALDDPSRGAELLPALMALAREGGCPMLGVATVQGEPDREALAGRDGFVRRATNMALPLDGALGDPGGLELRPMTREAFDAYLANSSEEYVGELVAAGMSPEAARRQGEEQLAELLPNGLDSPGQWFFTARAGETPVGTLWLSTENALAFVYDIKVREDQRRRGHGEAIMNAAARWCRDRGHPGLGLNVFGHNPGARALYDKLGYRVTRDFGTYDVGDGS